MKSKVTLCTFLIFTMLFCACSDKNQNTENNTNTNQSPLKTQPPATTISEEDAKVIALKHAGLNMNQINHIQSTLDKNDRIKHYDVEFYSYDNQEYDYEIAQDTGEILEWDVEPLQD